MFTASATCMYSLADIFQSCTRFSKIVLDSPAIRHHLKFVCRYHVYVGHVLIKENIHTLNDITYQVVKTPGKENSLPPPSKCTWSIKITTQCKSENRFHSVNTSKRYEHMINMQNDSSITNNNIFELIQLQKATLCRSQNNTIHAAKNNNNVAKQTNGHFSARSICID